MRTFAIFSKISGIHPFRDLEAWLKNFKRKTAVKAIITISLFLIIIFSFIAKIEILKIISIIIFFLWLLVVIKKVTNWIIVTALFLFILLSANELSKNTVVMKELAVAPQFLEKYNGFTGDVLASHIYDEINSITHKLSVADPGNSSVLNQNPKDRLIYDINSSAAPEIYYQQIGISLNALYQNIKKSGYFKGLFHYKYYIIDGDITKEAKSGKWYLTMRISEENWKISQRFEWNEDNTPKDIAEFILEYVDIPNLARYYQYEKLYDKLISACIDNIRWKGHNAEIHNILGIAYSLKDQYDIASQEFMIAKQIDPKYVKSYYNLGITSFKKGQIYESIAYFQQALKLQPNQTELYAAIGQIYYSNNETDKSIQYFRKAISQQANNPVYLLMLAKAYIKNNSPDNAIKFLKKALKISPNQAEIYYTLSQVYGQKKQVNEDIDAFNKFIYLCNQYIENNQIDRAIINLVEAVNERPEIPELYLALSKAYIKKGDNNSAINALRYFIRYWKGDPQMIDEANKEINKLSSKK